MKLIPGLLTCMTAVVIASHQNACCCMAQYKPTHYAFGNFIARTAWQAYASVKVKNNSNDWYTSAEYNESIYNVIGQVLSDCQYIVNEFFQATKATPPKGKIQIVEFANTTPANYDNSNWNAVILWNYFAEAIHGYLTGKKMIGDDGIEEVGKIVKNYYDGQDIADLAGKINKAVSDIKEYAKVLDLHDYIKRIHSQSDMARPQRYAPEANCENDYNPLVHGGVFYIARACVTIEGENVTTPLMIRMYGGNVHEIATKYGRFRNIDNYMNLYNRISETYLANFDVALLSSQNVHNLTNFGKVDYSLTASKCFFNATMQALHASPTIRYVVDTLATKYNELKMAKGQSRDGKSTPTYSISRTLKRFFDGIENGTMDKHRSDTGYNKQNDENYTKALNELIETMKHNIRMRAFRAVHGFVDYSLCKNVDYTNELNDIENHGIQHLEIKRDVYTGASASVAMQQILDALNLELEQWGERKPTKRIDAKTIKFIKAKMTQHKIITNAKNQPNDNKIIAEGDVKETIIKLSQLGGATALSNYSKEEIPYNEVENLTIMPQVLIIEANKSQEESTTNLAGKTIVTKQSEILDITAPEEMEVTDDIGTHRYRLVSTVEAASSTGGHYVAEIKTKDGWREANDTQTDIRYKPYTSSNTGNRYKEILIYEKCS